MGAGAAEPQPFRIRAVKIIIASIIWVVRFLNEAFIVGSSSLFIPFDLIYDECRRVLHGITKIFCY